MFSGEKSHITEISFVSKVSLKAVCLTEGLIRLQRKDKLMHVYMLGQRIVRHPWRLVHFKGMLLV